MEDKVFVAYVDGKTFGVRDDICRLMEDLLYADVKEAEIEEFYICEEAQRGIKYKAFPCEDRTEVIKPTMNFNCYFSKWHLSTDGRAYNVTDENLFALQCTKDCFDIPAMAKDIREHGYDVTDDMLMRFVEMWLKREGKNYMMERGITLYAPCSCCNCFDLTIYFNGEPDFVEMYSV